MRAADMRGHMERIWRAVRMESRFSGGGAPRNKRRGVLAWEKGEIFPRVCGMFSRGDMFLRRIL